MRKKSNIYDADDVERSKRLTFTPEERAARAEHKAEVLGKKLEQAQKKIPKKKKLRLQKELDPQKSKLKHTLRFEEVEKKRGKEALPKKASRRMAQSASAAVHSKLHQVEEENVGTKAAHRTELAAEGAATAATHAARKHHLNAPYKRVEKLEVKVNKANAEAAFRATVRDNPELQQNTVKSFFQKRRIKRQYAKEFRKAQKNAGQGVAATKKAKEVISSAGQAVVNAVKNHKGGLMVFGILALLVIMVFSSLSSCSVMMEGAIGSILGTSYTSEDPDIIQTEANYTALESELQRKLANIESTYSGYDEYRYDVDSVGHNPNELISYLTAKFDAFTPEQVQAELEAVFEKQYSLTTREVAEIRYRTETRTGTTTSTDPETGETTTEEYTYEVEVPYEYTILYVTLRNKGFGTVAVEGLTEEQKERYAATLSMKGNKPYLFGNDIYANESAGEDYDIPGEALADPEFAALITEAEKYLGYPYVWGGSSPSTSFDCSGFVCYVFTNSGVHNLPRTTAQGIFNQCAHISPSEAKPGDIIFFTGTYNSSGPVSHVGIYVGDNMMIHCGSPIQYARTDSSYWSQHFYAFGRLN
ncbi:NlpC/P60 family protein [Eisenbergiella tayi]|uniref:NlpC/P60 family protein n=1 Tax=Eisenbergiella porci TaxID=2652274 RepID=A0A6N7WGZ8_9FIRM|nr:MULTISPECIES: NlpC/P60 family protein [Eisenbergiella]MSS88964.1 NlpC/P60 family protein [Eisenbergiella porci]